MELKVTLEKKIEMLEAENKKLSQKLMGTDPPTVQRISNLEVSVSLIQPDIAEPSVGSHVGFGLWQKQVFDVQQELKKEQTLLMSKEKELQMLLDQVRELKNQVRPLSLMIPFPLSDVLNT